MTCILMIIHAFLPIDTPQFQRLVDDSMANLHTSNCLNRWLGVRLESLGAAATLMASLVAVEQRGGASNAGLVLSYAMQLTINMSITLRQSSTVENNVSAGGHESYIHYLGC